MSIGSPTSDPPFRFAFEWPFWFWNLPCELVMEVTKELKWNISIFLFTQRRSVHIQNQRVEMRWGLRCIYTVNGGWADGMEMTLFLYPETQYSQSVVFSIEENVAQLNRKKKFIFHKNKLQNILYFINWSWFSFSPEWKGREGVLGPGNSNTAWFLLWF